MTLFKKTIYATVLVSSGLGFSSAFAQLEQATGETLEAIKHSEARAQSEQRVAREGEETLSSEAEVTKAEGADAVAAKQDVETAEEGEAEVSSSSREVAGEARTPRPNPADSANSLRGTGR